MGFTLQDVYATIQERQANPVEGSYTGYLFAQGLDKILKKVGEETAETLIAAKNGVAADTVGEIADLAYHILVLMAAQGITPDDVAALLEQRHSKSGNLKAMKTVDRNT